MKKEKLSKAAASGAVALIFLILGFQAAIFTGNVFRYNREHRVDTVYVAANNLHGKDSVSAGHKNVDFMKGPATGASEGGDRLSVREQDFHGRHMPGTGGKAGGKLVNRGIAPPWEPDYGDSRQIIAEKVKKKPEPELFQFDPNTVTTEELVRLGFSERQAQVIENYRNKGGKYNRPRDFAKMYVVDSAMFARLEPYIRITRMNLNTADSLSLLTLRGIGPYYAHKIIEYRRRLGGVFTSKEQLLEIEGLDADRLAGFESSVDLGDARPAFTLWNADKATLAAHPYIGTYAAKGILRYKSVTDTSSWDLEHLVANGVIKASDAPRLKYLDLVERD